jgi:flagellin-like hook-associated protein FlgL
MLSSTSLYPFAAGSVRSQTNARMLAGLRAELQDLQRQLASGKRSETYGGLGDKRVSALTFRNQTGVSEGYKSLVELTDVRLQVMTKRTEEISKTIEGARSVMLRQRGTGGYTELTAAKQQIQASFEQVITSLNAQHEGLYLFSGRSRDTRPVVDANTLMWGDGTNAGLRQVIDERRQADLGATGLGRMTTLVAGSNVTLSEEAPAQPFGIKLVPGSIGGSMSGVTITGPTVAAPRQLDINFTGIPNAGERISFTVTLPDGRTKNLGFAVGQAGSSDDTVFAAGATPAATAINLESAIVARLTSLGTGELRSASGVIAAREFFSGTNTTQPPRVAGPPFNTSTAYAAPGSRPTVIWYRGDDDTTLAARDTQRAEVADGTTVSTGSRANEVPFMDSLVAIGLFLAEDYPPNVASTQDRFDAATARAIEIMNTTGGPGALLEVVGDFGRATTQVREAKTRHEDQLLFLNGLLAEIENTKNEEVAVAMVTLQTRLEASYQTTATLSRLSLVNFI